MHHAPLGKLHSHRHLVPALRVLVCVVLVADGVGIACAQAPVDLEQRSQEQERRAREQRLEQERQVQAPDVHLPRPATPNLHRLPVNEVPCFDIQQLHLAGDTADRFDWLLSYADGRTQLPEPEPVQGRCLGALGIQTVLDRLQSALIAQGYVTSRVVAQPQNLKHGDFTVLLIPGLIESIEWKEGSGPRASLWNTVPARAGDVLNLRDIEQALENFKRVPSVEADIQIAPGSEPGTSRLLIAHRQSMPFRISATVDDSGTRSTGKIQGSLNLSYDNWWTLSDLFYITWTHDLGGGDKGKRGNQGQVVHYSVPFGYGFLSLSQSDNQYHQSVAGAQQNYLYSGTSRLSEVKFARVLHRDAVGKTSASLKGFLRSSNNYVDDTEVEVQRRVVGGFEAGLNHHRSWDGGQFDTNVQFRQGTGAWGSLPAPEERSGEGTSRMKLWMLDATLQQSFVLGGQRMNYMGSSRAQHNKTPLTPQDRFAIGGRYTVRGFDGASVLMAERGWLLRNEIATYLSSGHQVYVGVDGGQVAGASTARLVGTSLSGGAAGLRGHWSAFQYDVFVGRPLRMPRGFKTSTSTAGFSMSISF